MVTIQSMVDLYATTGYLAVFGVLLLCGFGLPIPEDISIIAGGIISGLGYTNVHLMFLVCLAGVLIGDTSIYFIGRTFRESVFNKKIGKKILSHDWYDRILKSFKKNGKMVLFAARFMPGLRTPIFITAGITKFVRFWKFIIIDGFAALISVPLWLYLGYYGASNREWLAKIMRDTKIGIFIVIGLVVILYIVSKYFKKKLEKVEIVSGPDTKKK